MEYLSIQWSHHHRYYLLYLSLLIACLLLGLTNATNQTVENNEGLLDKVSTYLLQSLTDGSNETLTTNNGTNNITETSIFHKPKNMSDVQRILSIILRLFAQVFIIFGGVIPYIPQYLIIKRKQNAEGFSNYVCLTLLVANILRIEFWFGKHFELPLLLQSIVMILCMLIMLEIWTRVHARTMQNQLSASSAPDRQDISTSREQLTEEVIVKKFTDFEMNYFWRWTKFASYIQFLLLITLILTIITWVFIKNVVYIETIGFLAVFCEALLGMPQFVRNCRLQSTEGMSVKMVLLWAAGDIFKTVYFIFRDAPKQFWVCGILQISIDVAILCQVVVFATKYRFFREQ